MKDSEFSRFSSKICDQAVGQKILLFEHDTRPISGASLMVAV